LAAHQLTDIQRVEQLFNLAAQKPLELLAEMLRLCPIGQEKNAFFNCLFLNKLPRELHILLSEADKLAALCARADLFATHTTNYCLAGLNNNKGLFSIRFPYCFQIPCSALEAFCYTMHNATTEPTVLLDSWRNIAGFLTSLSRFLGDQSLSSSYLSISAKAESNSERDSIVPCTIKSSFKSGLQISV
jgi:hypothetical protein